MKKWLYSIAGFCFAFAGSLAAQTQAPAISPPNILSIESDDIKAYETAPYDKVAAEYPAVSEQYKDDVHYLAIESMSGPPRAMYLLRFDSFEEMQKETEKFMGNAAMHAKFSALDAREAPYVSEVHNTVWHYRPDLSNNVEGADIPHSHYWETIIFHMHPGHDQQFDELTKLYRDASLKSGQNIPWATFESMMGAQDAYLIMVPMTSLKDEDTGLAHQKDFMAALGKDGAQQMDKLNFEGVASVEDNIWMVNPASSYVEKSWVEGDPKYWAPKPAAKPAPKPAAGAAAAPKAPATQ